MSDERTLFELEATHDRAELAALFEEFAAALETGRAARIAVDEGTASITFPDRIDVELEGETGGGPPAEVELEIELEWEESAERESVRLEGGDATPPGDSGADSANDADEASEANDAVPDPAAATMPADATAERDAAEEGGGRTARFEVYRDRAEEWRWRLVHWNGNILADSGEGYASRYNATRAARSVVRNASTARIERAKE